jgi:protein-S-isoprenylcysteine O-methyltransferase Ste14
MANPELIARAVFIAVILGWSAYPIIFFFRRKPPPAEDHKRDQRSVVGIIMQGVAFAIVWSIQRPLFTPILQVGFPLDIGLAVTTITLLIGSLWITWAALRLLGKQWSFAARLVTEHLLITEGPYRIVRHPIYTGMLGMLIAAGLAASYWVAFIVALVVFLLGTSIRIRSEERLLREAFGQAYEEYAEKVPAIIPFGLGI